MGRHNYEVIRKLEMKCDIDVDGESDVHIIWDTTKKSSEIISSNVIVV